MTPGPLEGQIVGVSIGAAPDLLKLGYPLREVDRVLFTMCATLVRAGARVLYGGNLDPDGYTFRIFRHLSTAYAARREIPPFIHLLPEPVWRSSSFEDLWRALTEAHGISETWSVQDGQIAGVLAPDGDSIALHSRDGGSKRFDKETFREWCGGPPGTPAAPAFSAMRALAADLSAARIVMGGRMGILDLPLDRYEGDMPGVAEEAIRTLERNKPLVVLGAFGGAARDVAIHLGLLPPESGVQRGPQLDTYRGAMKDVAELRPRLDRRDLDELRMLATLDRAEELAYRTARLLAARIGPSS